jgi:predicted transcriptional regulator of viral defense system
MLVNYRFLELIRLFKEGLIDRVADGFYVINNKGLEELKTKEFTK